MSEIFYGNSLKTAGQFPLDAKSISLSKSDLTTNININAYRYYEGMLVKCLEDDKKYIWSERKTPSDKGLLTADFVYPNNTISNNVDYSNRQFNFFEEIVINSDEYKQITNSVQKNVEGDENKFFNEKGVAVTIPVRGFMKLPKINLEANTPYEFTPPEGAESYQFRILNGTAELLVGSISGGSEFGSTDAEAANEQITIGLISGSIWLQSSVAIEVQPIIVQF